jgi:hypothetical protein
MNRQGGDTGVQYRTGIYYIDERDLPVIEKSIRALQRIRKANRYRGETAGKLSLRRNTISGILTKIQTLLPYTSRAI